MLGWHISIYRQNDHGVFPATTESAKGKCLAVWRTGLGGFHWIDDLAKQGRAVDLGGNGYPCRYTAIAEQLIPLIIEKPPGALNTWTYEPSDIFTENWNDKAVLDHAAAADCRPNEWLLVEAWDES